MDFCLLIEFPDHENSFNGVSIMRLALKLYTCDLRPTGWRPCWILPSGASLGARQKCKPYGTIDLWAKFGAFGRI